MKRFLLALILLSFWNPIVRAGTYSDKTEVRPPPQIEWYRDNEWNVNLWGTYAFTNTEYEPNLDLVDLIVSTTEGHTVFGSFDRYIGGDHAWGGGGDFKYFFHRYFGIGIEGFALDAHRNEVNIEVFDNVSELSKFADRRVVGSVLGTFTLRYPVPGSRFAPYAWAGVGAIFGGGQHETITATELDATTQPLGDGLEVHTQHFGSETKLMGQFGAGLEMRITPHIGWTNDLSWGVIDGPQNNFGMFRSGLNFAF